jgi:Tol biopolymer transport system component
MKLLRTLITAIISVAAAALAATGSAGPVVNGPPLSKIAYFSFDQRDKGLDVMLVNTDGSGATNITHDGTAKQNVDPNWSANGLKVAFTSYNTTGGSNIMVVNANGRGLVNLTGGPGLTARVLNIHPTFSPDGSIVFASNRDGNFDLYRIGMTATNQLVRMTKTAAPIQNLDPDYSANGKLLVFSRVGLGNVTTGAGPAALYWMRSIPNSPATRLTKPWAGVGDRGAAWSPDGRQIAFYSDRAGNNDLYLVNFNGTGLTQLTFAKAADREPSWSPTGTSLVFLSDRTTRTELWMTSLVGVGPGPLPTWQFTFDKISKGAPDWQPFGPVPSPSAG